MYLRILEIDEFVISDLGVVPPTTRKVLKI